MKKFFYILTVLLIASCSDKLEIEPEQSLSVGAAFSDENTTRASLNGVYSECQDLDVFGSMPQIINDYMADNVEFIGSFPTLQDIRLYNTLADNASVSSWFRDHYQAILAANAVIAFTDAVADPAFDTAEKAEVIGEAKYLRAITYLSLVTTFGQPYTLNGGSSPGVALVLTPSVLQGSFDPVARNTVAEVYTQIIQDLKDAETALADSGNRTRATKGAAQGMLSRVYLYQGDYTNAETYAALVANNPNYVLATDYSFYNGETAEDVFSIKNTAIDNGRTGSGGWASYYNPAELNARGDCPFAADLLAAFDPADKRFTDLTQVGANGMTYTTKFPDPINNSDNSPIQRVTEIYLNLAEAQANNSMVPVSLQALDILNMLRTRAGLSTFVNTDFADKAAFIAQILEERRKELCFEGHRRLDLLRVGQQLRAGDPATAPGQDKVIMPIPQREIDLGSSTPQNAGY